MPEPELADPEDLVGTIVARYEIQEFAGSGGMGRVFRARDRRLKRFVALKLLHPHQVQDPIRRARLLREARAAARLRHIGIVSIYDVGEDQGLDFIAMEWVDGATLRQRLDSGPLSTPELLSYSLQLAQAIAVAHEAGIVHCDLKPQNIMIDTRQQVRVLDFGVARSDPIADSETLTETLPSNSDRTPGTAAYMAPEQALGEGVSPRSDIFSFGVVVYEMATGRRPFRGPDLATLLKQLLFAEPQSIEEQRRDSCSELAAVIDRTLAKKPQDRYPSMDAIAAALREIEAAAVASSTHEEPETSFLEPKLGIGRSSAAMLAWGAALAFVLAVATIRLVPSDLWMESGTPTQELPLSPYLAYQKGEELLTRYDRVGYLERAIEHFEQAIHLDEAYAPPHSGLSRAFWWRFRNRKDLTWLDRAEGSARHAVELDPHLSHARVSLALVKASRGDFAEARRSLTEVRQLDPSNADVWAGLAQVALLEDQPQLSIAPYLRAIELEPTNWSYYCYLGIAQARAGNLEAAETALRKSIEIAPDNAYAHMNLGGIYHFLERYEEAISELQRSISIRPSKTAYSNLGTLYFFQKQFRAAAAAFQSALDMGANNYRVWANLGDAYRQIPGKEDDAAASFERAIQLVRQHLESTPNSLPARSRLGLYLAKRGDEEAAVLEATSIIPLATQDMHTIYRVAMTFELSGRRPKALEALELALSRGYSLGELHNEPELVFLREDVRFHQLAARFGAARRINDTH